MFIVSFGYHCSDKSFIIFLLRESLLMLVLIISVYLFFLLLSFDDGSTLAFGMMCDIDVL